MSGFLFFELTLDTPVSMKLKFTLKFYKFFKIKITNLILPNPKLLKGVKMKAKTYISSVLIFIINIVFINQSVAQMFWNQACGFNGGTDSSHVSVRHSASLDITGSFTIEAWVNPADVTNPSFQIIMQKRNASPDGYTLYISNGKVAIRTSSATRLTGNAVIPNNSWSHIAGTFNSATNTFITYVNGTFDASAVVAASAPVSNTDSLWIGKGSNSPFKGQMDEVRIWNRALSSTEINDFKYTTLGSSTGPYNGLVLSQTYQDNDAAGSDFSLSDWSGNSNTGILRGGATSVDLSNKPLQTIQMNDCIELDGSNDYLAGPDHSTLHPTTQLTLSAWIYLRSYANSIIIHKGGASGGATTNYRLSIVGRKLTAMVNGNFNFSTNDTIPLGKWTNVVFTYFASLGAYQYHINGQLVFQGTNPVGNVNVSTDSIYIGGTPSLINFDGYIDEVRIIPDVIYTEAINQNMFKSIELSNGGAGNYAIFNFDGYAYNNGGSTAPLLRFNGNGSGFAHCGSVNDQPQSPLDRADNLNFQSGFQQKISDKRIPATGFSGSTSDSLNILLNETITDINVFVALNHNVGQDLQIFLIGPSSNVQLTGNNTFVGNTDNMVTVFDDDAGNSIVNGTYVSFSPSIKPMQNMNSVFGGSNSQGLWRLLIRDVINGASADTGILYGWGIQFNNKTAKPYLLNANSLVQGFYNSGTNLMISDTMRYYIRNTGIPYGIYDSAKAYLTGTGFTQLNLPNVNSGVALYMQLKHRNSLETWGIPFIFDPLSYQAIYDFRTSNTQAYGNNELQVDNSPVAYAIISGDVDQDGTIDASDLSIVENNATVGTIGYVKSDITGDDFVDGSDVGLVENNIGYSKSVPPGAIPPPADLELTEQEFVSFSDPAIKISDNTQNSFIKKRYRDEKER